MNYLNLENVSFHYSDKVILDKISFSVEKGSFTCLLGPNGCGKTTLLKLIARLLLPKEGKIFLEETSLSSYAQKELFLKMAYLPQSLSLTFPIPAMNLVLLGRAPHLKGLSFESKKDFEIAKECLEKTSSWDLKDRLFNTLSGGEKQRVLLAKALAQEPHLLLLDEPTAHLDLRHQIEMLSLLKKLRGTKNLTIFMVLHDLSLASEFAEQVIILKDKRIFAEGTPKKLLTEKTISEIFGVSVSVDENPHTKNIRLTYKEIPSFQKDL